MAVLEVLGTRLEDLQHIFLHLVDVLTELHLWLLGLLVTPEVFGMTDNDAPPRRGIIGLGYYPDEEVVLGGYILPWPMRTGELFSRFISEQLLPTSDNVRQQHKQKFEDAAIAMSTYCTLPQPLPTSITGWRHLICR